MEETLWRGPTGLASEVLLAGASIGPLLSLIGIAPTIGRARTPSCLKPQSPAALCRLLRDMELYQWVV